MFRSFGFLTSRSDIQDPEKEGAAATEWSCVSFSLGSWEWFCVVIGGGPSCQIDGGPTICH